MNERERERERQEITSISGQIIFHSCNPIQLKVRINKLLYVLHFQRQMVEMKIKKSRGK